MNKEKETIKEKRFIGEEIGEILQIIFALIIIGVLIWSFLAAFGIVEPLGGYMSEEEFYETDQSVRCFMGFCY